MPKLLQGLPFTNTNTPSDGLKTVVCSLSQTFIIWERYSPVEQALRYHLLFIFYFLYFIFIFYILYFIFYIIYILFVFSLRTMRNNIDLVDIWRSIAWIKKGSFIETHHRRRFRRLERFNLESTLEHSWTFLPNPPTS